MGKGDPSKLTFRSGDVAWIGQNALVRKLNVASKCQIMEIEMMNRGGIEKSRRGLRDAS